MKYLFTVTGTVEADNAGEVESRVQHAIEEHVGAEVDDIEISRDTEDEEEEATT